MIGMEERRWALSSVGSHSSIQTRHVLKHFWADQASIYSLLETAEPKGCECRTRAMGTGLSFASEPIPLGAWMCSIPASALKSPLWGRTPEHKPASLQVLHWRDVSNKQLLLTVISLELTRCLGGSWLLQPDSTPAALETSLLYLTTVLMPESFKGHSSLGITEKLLGK